MKCSKCNENRESIHYRAKDRGICVFCANELSSDQLIEKIGSAAAQRKLLRGNKTPSKVVLKTVTKIVPKVITKYVKQDPKIIVEYKDRYIEKEPDVIIKYIVSEDTTSKRKKRRKPTNTKYASKKESFYIQYKLNVLEKRKMTFNLDIDTFFALKEENCFYCGGKGGGIDRVFNERGYEPDNCVPCCTTCNLMKRTMGVFSFIDHCRRIIDNVDRE